MPSEGGVAGDNAQERMMNFEEKVNREIKAQAVWHDDWGKTLYPTPSNAEKMAILEKEVAAMNASDLGTTNQTYGKVFVKGFKDVKGKNHGITSDPKLGGPTSNCNLG
jgi:hypothetical protein